MKLKTTLAHDFSAAKKIHSLDASTAHVVSGWVLLVGLSPWLRAVRCRWCYASVTTRRAGSGLL
jgi:hypothetical protein